MRNLILYLSYFIITANTCFAIETITINKGILEPTPIAINQFASKDGIDQNISELITRVIASDLKNSGLFRPISVNAFIETTLGIEHKPLFATWRQINASLLLNGDVVNVSRNQIRIRFVLWDTILEQPIVAEELILGTDLYRRAAHKIADKIYESITGEKGYFDTKVIYISESKQRGQHKRMAIMDYDGANHQFLTDGKAMVLTPRLSPHCDKVLYLTYNKKIPTVRLRDLRTGRDTQLGQFEGLSFAPRFSPDGSHALVSISKSGNTHIYELNLSNGRRTQLTTGYGINTSPTYSPDGSKIVFNSDRDGTRQLYVMNRDGSNQHKISNGIGAYATPVWSPKGDHVVFTKMGSGIGFGIGVMRPDGTGEHIITTGYLVEGPTWAPNGRMIMYTKEWPIQKNIKSKVFSIDIAGNHEQQIHTPFDASDPEWSLPLE